MAGQKPDYTISEIYPGGYSSLNPSRDSYITAGSLSTTTDPRNANFLKEVSDKLSMGVKNIEITAVTPQVFDSVPKQQLKEINRLAKLTGIDISLHGPVIDVAGMNQQGYSEVERESAERKVTETLLRAKELSPDKNLPVVFHTAEGIPSSQFLPPGEREKAGTDYKRLIVVNRETGRMAPLEAERKFYPGKTQGYKPGVRQMLSSKQLTQQEIAKQPEKYLQEISLKEGEYLTPEDRIGVLNNSEWDNSLNQVFFNQERVQEILGKNQIQIAHLLGSINDMKKEGIGDEAIMGTLNDGQRAAYSNFVAAKNYLQDINQQANGLFSKAYEFGNDTQRRQLQKLSDSFEEMVKKNGEDPFSQAEAMKFLINELKSSVFTPKMYVPVEEFAAEKTSQTFGNSAFKAYQEYKKEGRKAPVIVIENPPAGFGLSTGKDVANVVIKSREQFVKNAVENGMSEKRAKKEAEKHIGATWDVGHINMLRGKGYTEEDIIKETEYVAPYVKHVHLSDNFGFEHTELPMGMGNTPLKKIMEKLGEKGYEAKKVIEAGNWWQHFRTPPLQETLEGIGSPVYSMKMSPSWDQAPQLYEGYFSGYGQMLPQGNYNMWGSGFSMASLPMELGGQMPGGGGGRMSGRPMH